MHTYLSIDLGSTAFKASIFSQENKELSVEESKFQYLKNDVEVEMSVEELEKTFDFVVSKAIASAGISFKDIKGIGVSSQAQTFTISNANYEPQLPFISWMDMRAVDIYKNLKNTFESKEFAENCSFSNLIPGLQLVKLAWFIKKSPELFKTKWHLIPLPSYFMMKLTGKNISDDNIAAMSGLYSIKDQKWWNFILNHLNISSKNLPRCLKIGESEQVKPNNKYGFIPGIPVYSCGNDQTASAFGAKLKKNDILITLGTAQVVYSCKEKLPSPFEDSIRGNYPNGLFYKMYAKAGGSLIRKAIEEYPEFKDYDNFDKLANSCTENKTIEFINDELNNKISWSDNNATLEAKARAIFEHLAQECNNMLNKLDYKNAKNIYISGGGVKNKIWLKIIEEKILHPLNIINTSPAKGSLIMAKLSHLTPFN